MKKALCILTAILLLASGVALAEGASILNPNGYTLLKITDIYTNDDAENGAEALVVQGMFGSVGETAMTEDETELAPEADPDAVTEMLGFDPEDVRSVTLAESCEILLPADPTDPTEYTKIDDLQAWYDNANEVMADYFDEGQGSYEFYASFEMNDEGELTRLEYMYLG